MTVAQNIFVNKQPRETASAVIDTRAVKTRAKALLDDLEAPIDVNEKVKRLSVADQSDGENRPRRKRSEADSLQRTDRRARWA